MRKRLKHSLNAWARTLLPDANSLLKLGSEDAGWIVPQPSLLPEGPYYLFGAGHDISFDVSLCLMDNIEAHCFEPMSLEFERTQKAYHSLPGLYLHNYGVGRRDGRQTFYIPQDRRLVGPSTHLRGHTERTEEAQLYTLPSIMGRLGHRQLALLKLDIEGSEASILQQLEEQQIYPKLLLFEADLHQGILPHLKSTYQLLRNYSLLAIDGKNLSWALTSWWGQQHG